MPREFMKVALLTLGCRVNQSESAIIEGTLKANGVIIVDLNDNPDVCIVNTCTVTAKSDYNSRQIIRRAARTGAKVIVTGCYSQLRPERVREISGVVKIVDNERKHEIVELLTNEPKSLYFGSYNRSRPYLKVQDGCNFHCSYCSVPLARGRSRSIPVDEVIEKARQIEGGGYKEVVLTGIHLGTYGYDLPVRSDLNRLIKKIMRDTRIHRIRLSSLEVNEVDDELIELFQEPRICRHLHLPLQSGSSRILNLMRRTYTAEAYTSRVEAIASKVGNISLGTDLIVGFPGEEDRDFSDTYSLVSNLPFSYLHIFPFSARPDTDASRLKNGIPARKVTERLERMRSLHKLKKAQYMTEQLRRDIEIIVEERLSHDMISGTSGNYLKVRALSCEYSKGSLVTVRPESIVEEALCGVIIQ